MNVVLKKYRIDSPVGLAPDSVHVWVSTEWAEEIPDCFTPEERVRGDRYQSEQVRRQFLHCRAMVRTLLGSYLGCSASAVPLTLRPDGKPILAEDSGLHFNMSHTDGLALVAVAERPVGVDAERLRPMPSAGDLVNRFFSEAESEQYRRIPEEFRLAAFFRGWTCKEAVLKGIGCGSRELDRAVVDLDPRRPAAILGPVETLANWRVSTWTPTPNHAAALAFTVSDSSGAIELPPGSGVG